MINSCIFCNIIQKKINSLIIYENKYVIGFMDISPAEKGHIILIPKKHFKNFIETDEKYLLEIIKAQKIIANHLYKKLNCLGMNYLSNENAIAGQKVFHCHIHIIPKFSKENGFILKTIKNSIDINSIYKKIGRI